MAEKCDDCIGLNRVDNAMNVAKSSKLAEGARATTQDDIDKAVDNDGPDSE